MSMYDASNPRCDGFLCEAIAYPLDASRPIVLARYRVPTARQALRRLRTQASRIANGLDPQPSYGPLPARALREQRLPYAYDPGVTFRRWLADERAQTHDLGQLLAGGRVSVLARDDDSLYVLTAHTIPSRPRVSHAPTPRRALWVLPSTR